jgi:hypothetical protein
MEPEEEEEPTAEQYRKRAAKTREIAQSIRNCEYAGHLASVAREYDAMADRLEAAASGKPKTD